MIFNQDEPEVYDFRGKRIEWPPTEPTYENPERRTVDVPTDLPPHRHEGRGLLVIALLAIVCVASLFLGVWIEKNRPWPCEPRQLMDAEGRCIQVGGM